jgi:hypothetical protein
MKDDQKRVLVAWGFDPDSAAGHYNLDEDRRRQVLSLPVVLPREWAAGVLEMLRMCWAKSEGWDEQAEADMAYWIWHHYPELFVENRSGCLILLFEPHGLKRVGPCTVPGWENC